MLVASDVVSIGGCRNADYSKLNEVVVLMLALVLIFIWIYCACRMYHIHML